MYRTTIAAAALTLLLAGPLSAQEPERAVSDEVLVTQVQNQPALNRPDAEDLVWPLGLLPGLQGLSGVDAVLDGLRGVQGEGNTAIVEQTGDRNSVRIEQYGLRNVAVAYQRGDDNAIDLVQDGDRNVFGTWLLGSRNTVELEQRGSDNVYLLGFLGNDLDMPSVRPHRTTQEGDGNLAVQVGIGFLPFGIVQRGSGMEIRVEHNPAVVPTGQ